MADITWQDPPPRQRRGRPNRYVDLVAELRRNPGRWAVLSEDAPTSYAVNVKKGQLGFSPAGAFEAVSRDVTSKGRGKVYVRFVGDPS